jgi:broad specificity phosphatase PhoE
MSQIVWIARHANRLDFVNPDWFLTASRRYDPPLSDDGILQAKQLAKRLQAEKITQIFASPFLRTVQTANEIAQIKGLPIKLETGLSEWLNPAWMNAAPERHPIAELAKIFPIDTTYTSRVAANYPETSQQALFRSGQTAIRLADEFVHENILLVGHGASVHGAIMGLVPKIVEVKVSLCSLFKVVRHHPEWLLELNGDTSHLSEVEEAIRYN